MLLLLTVAAAVAGDQHFVYDLTVNGQSVGSRDVTVRYYDRPGGERRVVDAVTTVKLLNTALDARSSGQSNPRGATFSTSVAVDGKVRQVQGVQLPEGDWRLVQGDGKTVNEQVVRGATVLTTIDLLDPGRTSLLGQGGTATLVFAETGDVFTGTLGAGAPATVTVAAVRVGVTRYTMSGSGASAKFDVDGDGLLVHSEVTWMGVPMAATLKEMPAPRDFGKVDAVDLMGTVIEEGGL